MITLKEFDTHFFLKFEYKLTKNLITEDFLDSFIEKINFIKKKNSPKVVFITGYDQVFCLGVDFEKVKLKSNNPKFLREIKNYFVKAQKILSFLMTSDFITVALINGHAIGFGFELVMACDISICTKKAYLSMPQLHYGVHPDYLNFLCEYKKINKNIINRLTYLNEKIAPDDAKSFGLITEVLDEKPEQYLSNIIGKERLINSILQDKNISFYLYRKKEKEILKKIRDSQLRAFQNNYR